MVDRPLDPERPQLVPTWLEGPWSHIEREGGDTYHLLVFEFFDGGEVFVSFESCYGTDNGEGPNGWDEGTYSELTWTWGSDELDMPPGFEVTEDLPRFPAAWGRTHLSPVPGACDQLGFHEPGTEVGADHPRDGSLFSGAFCYGGEVCWSPGYFYECSGEARVCD